MSERPEVSIERPGIVIENLGEAGRESTRETERSQKSPGYKRYRNNCTIGGISSNSQGILKIIAK
jgi:hypothetical protein